jgi:hypothetical protein
MAADARISDIASHSLTEAGIITIWNLIAARPDVRRARQGSRLGKPGLIFVRVANDRDYRGMIV